MKLEQLIRDVPDFPKKGIVFKDITPLLADHAATAEVVAELCRPFAGKGVQIVAAIEARGFIFGALAAQVLAAAFVPIRKRGKLPYKTVAQTYDLEYGQDHIEMHDDAVRAGQKVLIVDDVLATGGTAAAACKLVRKVGGDVIAAAFVIELGFLGGRAKLGECGVVHSLLNVKG